MKKLLLLFLLIGTSICTTAQSSIGGVVTYYFNQYQGDKPDLGATVLVIDSAKIKNFDFKVYEKFRSAKVYRNIYENAKITSDNYEQLCRRTEGKKKYAAEYEDYKKRLESSKKDVAEYYDRLVESEAETEEKFKKIDNDLFLSLIKINEDDYMKKTIDAAGSFNVPVVPGTYYVYIKSKNRTSLTLTDARGQVYMKKVVIKANENKDISHNFGML